MHVVLGVLGAVVTILILLNRLSENGIDIGWLNPFALKRRREWAKKYNVNPAYAVSSPMEATALVMVAMAKNEGDISAEQKGELKRLFRSEFHLDEEKSTSLLASSTFLLKDVEKPLDNMDKLLEPSKNNFTEEQVESALSLIAQVANIEENASASQIAAIQKFKHSFRTLYGESEQWR